MRGDITAPFVAWVIIGEVGERGEPLRRSSERRCGGYGENDGDAEGDEPREPSENRFLADRETDSRIRLVRAQR
jgi:hypothetical protein